MVGTIILGELKGCCQRGKIEKATEWLEWWEDCVHQNMPKKRAGHLRWCSCGKNREALSVVEVVGVYQSGSTVQHISQPFLNLDRAMWLSSGQWASISNHNTFHESFHSFPFPLPDHLAKNKGFWGSKRWCYHRIEGTKILESLLEGKVYWTFRNRK